MVCLLLCFCFLAAATASACPGCKEGLSANEQRIAEGYFWSILFMLSMPMLIAGTFGTYVYIEVRRARRDREQLAAAEAAGSEANEPASISS